ncbi:MAG: Flp pilus assembly protein CpaB, partial [Vulcanimicrobiaceae bacterium]
MNTRRITFIVALLLALGSGFLTLRYFQSVAPTAAPKVQLKPVVVADHVIQPHTKITAAMLQITQRPVEQVDPDAISDPKQAEGTLSLISIPEGSIITHSKIGTPAQLGLESVLKPGERAVSIPIDRVKAVAGLIQPGDHVDVLAILPRVNNDIHAYTI